MSYNVWPIKDCECGRGTVLLAVDHICSKCRQDVTDAQAIIAEEKRLIMSGKEPQPGEKWLSPPMLMEMWASGRG